MVLLGSASPSPHPFCFWVLPLGGPHTSPTHLISTASSLHFSRFLLHSSFKKLAPLNHVFRRKDIWGERALQFIEINFLQSSNDDSTPTCSSGFSFFNGGKHRAYLGNGGMSDSNISSQSPFSGRNWTNILLAANILVYIAQLATQGKLLFWGAKINSFIDKGQWWRLVTSSFLHANIGHLMVNCYSLNSIGPTVELFSGPRKFLALYFVSAIASSAMSYWKCKMPSIGASGAIFGLVGSLAVFVMRHRELIGGGKEDLLQIAHVITINMVIGLLSNRIDNWGHVGGLIGGAAASWLIGPAWKNESTNRDGRKVFIDRAPIYNIFQIKRLPRQ